MPYSKARAPVELQFNGFRLSSRVRFPRASHAFPPLSTSTAMRTAGRPATRSMKPKIAA